MGTIYLIRNTVNGKCYVGQTIHDPKERMRKHFSPSNRNTPINNAINKYGHDAFTLEILHEGVLDFMLDELEREEIIKNNSLTPNGYNLETGGNLNKTLSVETRRKLSEANKGKKLSAEARRKMSEAQKKRWADPEYRRKMSKARKGKKHPPRSAEARRNISEAQKKRKRGPLTPEHRRNISEGQKGNKRGPLSPEHSRKVSEGLKGNTNALGYTHSAETRRKVSEAIKGRKFSAEHKRKISEANKRRWANKKAQG